MSTMYVDNIVEKTSANGVHIKGHTIQTVSNGYRTYSQTSSASLVSMGLTATITPTSTTSKVLVNVKMNGMYMTGTGRYIVIHLYRNGVDAGRLMTTAGYVGTGDEPSYGTYTNCIEHLDSPSTASATTYTVMWKVSAGTAYLNNYNLLNGDTLSSITIQEIAQ